MKLSEKIRDAVEFIIEGPAVLLFKLADEVAQLEAENEELQELFVYFFGENYKELAKG